MLAAALVGLILTANCVKLYGSNREELFPPDQNRVLRCKQCGISFRTNLGQMEWISVVDSQPFVVSVWADNADVQASGWGEAWQQQKNGQYAAKVLFSSSCTNHNQPQVAYQLLVRVWRSNETYQDIALPARLLCVEEDPLNSIRDTLGLIYSAMWVSSMSLLPVFPILDPKLRTTILLFIIAVTLFQLPLLLHTLLLLTLFVMMMIYLWHQVWGGLPPHVVLQANLSSKANITLIISYVFMLIMSTAAFSGNMHVGPFQSLCIHLQNWLLLMLYGCLWCRVVWLNRFQHLFWYMMLVWVASYALSYYHHHNLGYFSLLLPHFYTTTCSYTTTAMSFMVLPVAKYLYRSDRRYQILGTIALVTTVVLPPQYAFGLTIVLLVVWIMLQCNRVGYECLLGYRWLSPQSFQLLQ